MPLGMMANFEYSDFELRLESGDFVVFYTDGIIEASNEAEEMYGVDRLMKLVESMDSELSAPGVVDAVFRDVREFVGDAAQYDDMTVVVVRKVWV